eukprot:226000-Pleurochrysis_carterae.AAC.3
MSYYVARHVCCVARATSSGRGTALNPSRRRYNACNIVMCDRRLVTMLQAFPYPIGSYSYEVQQHNNKVWVATVMGICWDMDICSMSIKIVDIARRRKKQA